MRSKTTLGGDALSFEVDTSDYDKFVDDFGVKVVDRVLELTSFALQGYLKREAPGGKTGDLRKRIEAPRKIAGSAWGINFGVDHWKYVNFGTKAHIIRPKKAGGVLRFEIGGTVVWAKVVHHPGTKPNPFVDRAIDRAYNDLPSITQQAIEEADRS